MTLQELINSVLADGSVTAQEGQDVMSRALMLGASAEDISALSGIPVSEINQFIAANNLQGNLAVEGSEYDLYTPPAQTPAPAPAPTPAPQPAAPVPTQQTSNATLVPLENLGNTFANNFGNNPGGLGFQDLDPIVGGADSVQRTAIPELLKPFIAQGVDSSQGALTSLTQLLARDNALTSPYNSHQELAQQQALDIANGFGGYLPNAQSALLEIADPTDVFDVFNIGRDLLTNPAGFNGLSDLVTGGFGNPTAMDTLEATARGDFLYGSPGFDEAVQASIRAARPQIQSGFALQGGQGAVGSGLAQAAIQEAASDAFARQFGAERDRMLGASGSLNSFNLNSNAQRLGAYNTMIGAQQNAGAIMSDLANADRSRQFQAAQLLPQFGLLQSQITGGVGDARQSQEERTKLGQIQAMQSLLSNSFGQINPNALFGNINSVTTNSNTAGGLLGGVAMGAGILDDLGLAKPLGNWVKGIFD